MTDLPQKLAAREDRYKDYLQQVDRFFLKASGTLFNAQFFPSIKFTRKTDPTWKVAGELMALGVRYEIGFTFAILGGQPYGVIELLIPATAYDVEQSLGRWFFDHLGNVRDKPAATPATHSIDDGDFLVKLVDTAERGYFALVAKSLES